jgi:formylglycine-generating enzyme required for sulfatase activity
VSISLALFTPGCTTTTSDLITATLALTTMPAIMPTESTLPPTDTFTLTSTLPPTPTILTPIIRNADWTPISHDFDGVTMLLVPVGCFEMGNDLESYDGSRMGVPDGGHQCFDQPFWIDRTEVTQADFERLGGQKANTVHLDDDQRPVTRITWIEANDFCTLRGMRLPTEREWEYAARGPDNLIYPWGNEWNPENAAWLENLDGQTSTVASRQEGVSWVGALDMSGNVWEWVNTIYGIDDGDYDFSESGERLYAYPYNVGDGRENISNDMAFAGVVRGGSWISEHRYLRGTARGMNIADDGNSLTGFRCARSYSL